ncbi:MAG: DUF4386 domain-containing protein [Terracidiphilus sp.]|jgi:hypothetical protein
MSIAQVAPDFKARIAGVFYVFNIVTSLFAFYGSHPQLAFVSGLIATATYIVVTILFYQLFKPVNRKLSLVAAFFSLAGCADGFFTSVHLLSLPVNILVFYGFYCVLIGYLILRSIFLPRFLGVLMMLAGFGYLTLLYPPLGNYLIPYNYIPGGVGEGLLTLWLLVKGVNVRRWKEQESSAS